MYRKLDRGSVSRSRRIEGNTVDGFGGWSVEKQDALTREEAAGK